MIRDVIMVLVGGVMGLVTVNIIEIVGRYTEQINPWNKQDTWNDFEEVE